MDRVDRAIWSRSLVIPARACGNAQAGLSRVRDTTGATRLAFRKVVP